VRRLIGLAVVGAALAALLTPALASGQGTKGATIRETTDSGFPDKIYTLQLPQKKTVTAENLAITENGGPVLAVSVEAPGAANAAILLIDASNSMAGAPIAGAMTAARAFMAQRNANLPVAVMTFGPEQSLLTGFTTDEGELAAAVADAPPLAEGTHIYDALVDAAELTRDEGLDRATVVLLSDGTDVGSGATRADALAELADASVRVFSVGLKSKQYDPEALKAIAGQTGGTYAESATPAALETIFSAISARLANEYTVAYRSLLPPQTKAAVKVEVAGFTAASASYTTPAIDFSRKGKFDQTWADEVITSGYLMAFVIVSVLALMAFALLTAFDVRSRSMKRRMAHYVNIPSEEEGRARRAEVTAMLAERAESRVRGHRWWQSFERDVEIADFKASPMTLVGWALIAGILTSIVCAIGLQSFGGLLVGLLAPVGLRLFVSLKLARKRAAFGEQLPDNLEVLAGALRAGHSLVGAMNVMVEGAAEPSKTEFRRVMQDEQLGVPIDETLMVMATRMANPDVEQVALVTRLQREAGGNTAEVLDRVVENIRGKMELRRLVKVLTAQGRMARWILTALPIVLAGWILVINPDWLDPLFETNLGRFALVMWVVMLIIGSYILKKITEIVV
jgi:tight adherence protein B